MNHSSVTVKHNSKTYVPENDIEIAKYRFFDDLLEKINKKKDIEVENHKNSNSNIKLFYQLNEDLSDKLFFQRKMNFKEGRTSKEPEKYFKVDLLGKIHSEYVLTTLDFESEIFGPKLWAGMHLDQDPFDSEDKTIERMFEMINSYYNQKLDEKKIEKYTKLLNSLEEEILTIE